MVSIDAVGCQTKIAEQIVEQGGDYLLQVKANQKGLLENIEDSFSLLKPLETAITEDVGHGRVEIRKCSIIDNLELIEQKNSRKNLSRLIKIESEIYTKKTGETTKNDRYYISSKNITALNSSNYIRSHWEIEAFHWSLDVVYHEDFQAKRNKNGIINFNTSIKCAISLLVEEKTFKKPKPLKQQRAFAQRDYRELILNC